MDKKTHCVVFWWLQISLIHVCFSTALWFDDLSSPNFSLTEIKQIWIYTSQISIGRTTKDNQVDVDLSLEGPSFKISRRQGAIKLRNSGEFILINNGKRPMYVDSKPVMPNAKLKLHNNSVIEVRLCEFWPVIGKGWNDWTPHTLFITYSVLVIGYHW